MKATERIAGYACEVNEEQWRELVKVADEVGLICPYPEFDSFYAFAFIDNENELDAHQTIKDAKNAGLTLISYPDFLAKLKGEEKWVPKAGEKVNGSINGNSWSDFADEYITEYCGMHILKHMTVNGEWIACVWKHVRPLRPTITRKEAEEKLKARIID